MATQSRLLTLPGEILTEILALTMASNEPADLRLFIDVLRDPEMEADGACPNVRLRVQTEHWLDWMFVTGTCRLFKCYGKTAFFREKSFTISTQCIQALDRVVASNRISTDLLVARVCVGNIVAPIAGIRINAWQMLPKLHFFERLRCLRIEFPIKVMGDRFLPEFPEQATEHDRQVPFEAPTYHLSSELNMLGVNAPIITFNWRLSMIKENSPSALALSGLESDIFFALRLAVDRQNPANIGQCYPYISPLGRLIGIV
ncbi:MAG: hypothetical protein LQ346_008252 [Caloplaca aetnensis]|nr:MAG: hypothetical protein LQ346_008252 [Caloplaca aetnensis]